MYDEYLTLTLMNHCMPIYCNASFVSMLDSLLYRSRVANIAINAWMLVCGHVYIYFHLELEYCAFPMLHIMGIIIVRFLLCGHE